MSKQDTVPVTQEDREAANGIVNELRDIIRPGGKAVSRFVLSQAFARHRIAAHQSSLADSELRKALIRCGRAAGAWLSDDVSNDFLLLVPGEVEARIQALRGNRDSVLEEAAKVADEFEAQENGTAYDRRQEGRSDNFNCARASAATHIAQAIRALKTKDQDHDN